jgi:DNA ligase-1
MNRSIWMPLATLGLTASASAAWAVVAESPPALLLARELGPSLSPAGYLVSEKFDGVRAFWDGRQLRFRGGGVIAAPDWFLKRLPPQALDGELWLGRGRFDEVSALLRRGQPDDSAWKLVNYLIFELPGAPGTFEARAAEIRALVAKQDWPALKAVDQFRVADRPALQRKLNEVVSAGGEGLALHRADALYITGRSEALLKFKPVQDADAVVIGHEPGQGKYAGQLGALKVRSDDGLEFRIGTGLSDALRRSPPPLGSRVSYRWRGKTSTGLPRFASLLRVIDPGT